MVTEYNPDKPYREYQFSRPILIAQVKAVSGKHSLEDIARWCGGEVVRSHSATSKVMGIKLSPADGELLVVVNDYILKMPNGRSFYRLTEHEYQRDYVRHFQKPGPKGKNAVYTET